MRILALSEAPDLPESHLLAGLARRGVEMHWAGDLASPRKATLEQGGVIVHPLSIRSRCSLGALVGIRELLQIHRFDLIHSFTSRALSNALIASCGLSVGHIAYRGTVGRLSRWDPSAWLTFLNPRIDAIVCVCDAVRESLKALHLPDERLHTIHKGHDLGWYTAPAPLTRSSLHIPDDAFVLGCTANIRRKKGIDLLITALEQLTCDRPIHLLLIGEIRDDAVSAQITASPKRGAIHLLGYRADAAAISQICDAVVMPSREREGLPKSIIEGMAYGRCAIVTDSGGMPELVTHELHGLVVPRGEIAPLRDAIERLACDRSLTIRLGAQARERIRTAFSAELTAERHLALYRQIIGARSGGISVSTSSRQHVAGNQAVISTSSARNVTQ
jgi:glycosyltransferase involved in cell wall biosynthesis